MTELVGAGFSETEVLNWSPRKIEWLFKEVQLARRRQMATLNLRLSGVIGLSIQNALESAGFVKGTKARMSRMLEDLTIEANGGDPKETSKQKGIASMLAAAKEKQKGT